MRSFDHRAEVPSNATEPIVLSSQRAETVPHLTDVAIRVVQVDVAIHVVQVDVALMQEALAASRPIGRRQNNSKPHRHRRPSR